MLCMGTPILGPQPNPGGEKIFFLQKSYNYISLERFFDVDQTFFRNMGLKIYHYRVTKAQRGKWAGWAPGKSPKINFVKSQTYIHHWNGILMLINFSYGQKAQKSIVFELWPREFLKNPKQTKIRTHSQKFNIHSPITHQPFVFGPFVHRKS